MDQLTLFSEKDRKLIKYESPHICRTNIEDEYLSLIKSGVSSSQILLLTYSATQAKILSEQIMKKLNRSIDESWIVSFSTFAWRIINEYGFESDIHITPEKINRTALQMYISKLIKKNEYSDFFLNNSDSAFFLNMIIEAFDWLALNSIKSDIFYEYFYSDKNMVDALFLLYKDYRQSLIENELADDNIITDICLEMLSNKVLCSDISARYKYVLVDKLEEVNYHHFRIIKRLFLDSYTPVKIYYNNELLRRGRNKDLFNKIKDEAQYILKSKDEETYKSCVANVHKLTRCKTIDQELKSCISNIYSEMLNNKLNWKDIVVSATDESMYHDRLRYLFKEQNIPFISSFGGDIYSSVVVGYLLDIVKYTEAQDKELFKKIAIRSGIINIDEYSKSSYELGMDVFTFFKSSSYKLIKEKVFDKKLIKLYFDLNSLKKDVAAESQHLKVLKLISDKYLAKFIKENNISGFDGESLKFVYSLVEDFDRVNTLLGVKDERCFSEVLFNLVSTYACFFCYEDKDIDAVRFVPYINLKTEQYKCLILLGANDHSLPGKVIGGANVVLDNLFSNLKVSEEKVVPPFISNKSHLDTERGTFYSAILNAEKACYISYAQVSSENEYDSSPFLSDYKIDEFKEEEFIDIYVSDKEYKPSNVNTHIDVKSKTYTASAIKKYLKCPRQYYFAKLLKIDPGNKDEILYIGNEVHHVLEKLHRIFPDINSVSKEHFKSIAGRLIEREWFGYELNRDYSHDRKDRLALKGTGQTFGKKAIAKYYFDSIVNIMTDYCDQIYIDNIGRRTIYQEKKIIFTIGGYRFYGEIDRVDQSSDGTIYIIDYKTQNQADKTARTEKTKYLSDGSEGWKPKDFQLPLYYMGARQILKTEIGSVEYYYLKHKKKDRKFIRVSIVINKQDDDRNNIVSITDTEMKQIEENIIDVIKRMESGSFNAMPESARVCTYCEYADVCREVVLS